MKKNNKEVGISGILMQQEMFSTKKSNFPLNCCPSLHYSLSVTIVHCMTCLCHVGSVRFRVYKPFPLHI